MTNGENGYLLDTNIVSDATKARPSSTIARFLEGVELREISVSVISIGEIVRGIEIAPPDKQGPLQEWLRRDIYGRFAGRIVPIDEEVMTTWGRMIVLTGMKPGQLPVLDGLIAATALHHGLTLVTRNTADFTVFKVPLLNPFAD